MDRTASSRFDTGFDRTSSRQHSTVEIERELNRLESLAKMMDARFGVPGFRFGFDSVIGLIPGIGDAAGGVISAYLIYRAHQLGADTDVKAKMVRNAGFDFALGLVPLVGDLGDVYFKANLRNVRLLTEHLREKHGIGMVDVTGDARLRDVTPKNATSKKRR
ncbi:DUF4112 domain-containing protein [Afifella sp. H1R]|uniref:DUF4112 domain-containing protein n=1 Tax=Afifella sp. H1R TaxID=2908841 RepID=UPI001F29E849|nr:DUF4112 domain-containing protein [Afifella sp. H1R]MCF1504655.1 DUF4112 domain-containing protein [Afifella sp. H1R]